MRTLSSADQAVLKIVTWLSAGRRVNVWVAYAVVTATVVGVELARIYFLGGVPKELPRMLYMPFIPLVILFALGFDRYTGIYATVLTAIVASATQGPIPNSVALRINLVPTFGFLFIGIFLATTLESLSHLLTRHRAMAERGEVLIRDLNHRVKNHLQAIAGMVHMARVKADPNSKEVLSTVASRLNILARLYDRLHLDSDNAAVRINVDEFLGNVCEELSEGVVGERAISISHTLDKTSITSAKAVPLGLLVNELVTNSLKHAFPDNEGHIDINFHQNGSGYVLNVSDTGIGGKNGTRGTGLRLIEMLTSQLDGSLEQRIDQGRSYTITFPPSLSEGVKDVH